MAIQAGLAALDGWDGFLARVIAEGNDAQAELKQLFDELRLAEGDK